MCDFEQECKDYKSEECDLYYLPDGIIPSCLIKNLKEEEAPLSVSSSVGLEGPMAGWISTKDKLPDKETEHCSVGCNFVDIDGAVFQGYCDWLDSDGEASWYSYEHRSYMENISHWMPLPEPPKAD